MSSNAVSVNRLHKTCGEMLEVGPMDILDTDLFHYNSRYNIILVKFFNGFKWIRKLKK